MIKEHALDDALVRRFEEYVNLYVEKFGITDWDIGITTCKSDTSDMANVAYVYPARAARIAIDEDGCIGAAFTVIESAPTGTPPNPNEIDFVLDRPFLFVVSSRDHLPLFAGVVNHP